MPAVLSVTQALVDSEVVFPLPMSNERLEYKPFPAITLNKTTSLSLVETTRNHNPK